MSAHSLLSCAQLTISYLDIPPYLEARQLSIASIGLPISLFCIPPIFNLTRHIPVSSFSSMSKECDLSSPDAMNHFFYELVSPVDLVVEIRSTNGLLLITP